MFESLFFQSLISFKFSFNDFDSPQTFLYVIYFNLKYISAPSHINNIQFLFGHPYKINPVVEQ
jgi:hypothetical protein